MAVVVATPLNTVDLDTLYLRLDCATDPIESADGQLVIKKTDIRIEDLTAGSLPGQGPKLSWVIQHDAGPLLVDIKPQWDTGKGVLVFSVASAYFSVGQHAAPSVVGFGVHGQMFPDVDNSYDFGYSGYRWQDFHLAGNLDDGTNQVTVAQLRVHLDSVANPHSVTAAQVGALANVVEDTTPQLGGALDCLDNELQNVGAAVTLNDHDECVLGTGAKSLRAVYIAAYTGAATSPQNSRGLRVLDATLGDVFIGPDSQFAGYVSQKSVKAGSVATGTTETASNFFQGNWGNGASPTYPFMEINWGVGDGSTGTYNASGTLATVRNGALTTGFYDATNAIGGGGLVVFGRKQLGGLYIVSDETNDWMELRAVGGVKSTQYYGSIAVGGTAVAFKPASDNAITLGTAALRWSDVRSVLINGADYGFANGWIIREWPATEQDVHTKSEAWMKAHAHKGIQFLNDMGNVVCIIARDGTVYANAFKELKDAA